MELVNTLVIFLALSILLYYPCVFVDDGDSFESLVRVLKLHILIAGTVLHILSLVNQTDYIKVEHIINRET